MKHLVINTVAFVVIISGATILSISQTNLANAQNLTKDLIIGDETDDTIFGSINNIDVDSMGNIFISDWNTKNIRVFDQNGKLIETIGKAGKGPGEFEKLLNTDLNGFGQLFAFDWKLLRVSIFDVSDPVKSKLVNTILLPKLESKMETASSANGVLTFHNKEDYLVEYTTPYSPGTGNVEREKKFLLFDKKGKIVKNPFLELPHDEKLVYDSGGNLSVSSMPFGRKSTIVVGPDDYIYTGWSEKLLIKKYNNDGELVSTFSDDLQPVEIPQAKLEKEYEENSLIQKYPDLKNQLPGTYPAYDWFLVDEQKRIWVATYMNNRDLFSVRIYKQQKEGLELTNEITINKTVTLEVITQNYAYGVDRPENGAPKVIKYEITKK